MARSNGVGELIKMLNEGGHKEAKLWMHHPMSALLVMCADNPTAVHAFVKGGGAPALTKVLQHVKDPSTLDLGAQLLFKIYGPDEASTR